MNILYLSMSFNPAKNGLYNNLVDALIERGHSVMVVRCDTSAKSVNINTITSSFKLLNVPALDPFVTNKVKKGIAQISLASSFKKAINHNLSSESYDLILYATPPVTLASVVKYCKEKYHAKTALMLKDIFPQNAVDLGMMKKDGLIYRFFRNSERKYYKYSDYIGCMSEGNKKFVMEHNPDIDISKLDIFPNSIDVSQTFDTVFNEDKTVFIYGGNLGKPQNISLIVKIADYYNNTNSVYFYIIGSGGQDYLLKEYVKNNDNPNLIYKEMLPQDEYESILINADVGLISLDPRFTIPNIPSRFQSYLKMKKPVFAFTDVNTDLKDIIIEQDCGWWCDASDFDSIVKTIDDIINNKQLQKEKGLNGFHYLLEAFDVKDNVIKLETLVNK